MQGIRKCLLPAVALSCYGMKPDEPTRDETIVELMRLKEVVDKVYARPEGMYSKVRKMLLEFEDNPQVTASARGILRQSRENFKALQKKAEEVVAHKNSHQTVLSMVYVREVVQRLKGSDVFSDKVVLLMLSCGARKIEILDSETSTFFGHDSLRTTITQMGVAKRRDGADVTPFNKPLLFISPEVFLQKIKEVREEVEARGKEGRIAIGKSFSHQLENLCQQLWPQHVDNGYRTGTHINRAIYANVAYKLHGTPNESLTHFIKNKLHHDTMGSAANYMNVSIAFDEESHLAEEAERQAVVLEPLKVALEDKDGHLHEFTKDPIRRLQPEDREDRAIEFARELRASGVDVNRKNLMELGVQSKIVTSSGVLDN
jgi:hypothetical protein